MNLNPLFSSVNLTRAGRKPGRFMRGQFLSAVLTAAKVKFICRSRRRNIGTKSPRHHRHTPYDLLRELLRG